MIVNIQEKMSREWKDAQQVNYDTVFAEMKAHQDNIENVME